MGPVRRLTVVGTLFLAVLAIGACGSDSGNDDVEDGRPPVATFDGKPITRAEFDDWFEASVANSRSNPQKEMMVVPDPPPHRRCLEGYDNIQTKASRYLRSEQPENECRAGWTSMMNSVMRDMITLRWLEAEARDQGIAVSDEEAHKIFAEDHLGTEAAKEYWGEQTYEDLVENLGADNALARARLFVLQQKIATEGRAPTPETTNDYRARTTCASGFRVTLCSNGPRVPEMPAESPPAEATP